MLQYENIDVSEGIDVNKISLSKESMICHYWFFKMDVGLKFEPHVCNKLKNIAILNVKGASARCILWGISRDEAVNRLNNSVLEDKGLLQKEVW